MTSDNMKSGISALSLSGIIVMIFWKIFPPIVMQVRGLGTFTGMPLLMPQGNRASLEKKAGSFIVLSNGLLIGDRILETKQDGGLFCTATGIFVRLVPDGMYKFADCTCRQLARLQIQHHRICDNQGAFAQEENMK